MQRPLNEEMFSLVLKEEDEAFCSLHPMTLQFRYSTKTRLLIEQGESHFEKYNMFQFLFSPFYSSLWLNRL